MQSKKVLADQIKALILFQVRSVFVSSGSFWGANDIKRMADFGLLKVLHERNILA